VDKLVNRKKKPAIVIVASVLATKPTAGILDYSCTKTFVDFLGQGLSYELEGKVDCISWRAGYVSTNMVKREAKGWVITPEIAVKGMLRDLGKERMTRGVFKHDLFMGLLFNYLPWRLLCAHVFKN